MGYLVMFFVKSIKHRKEMMVMSEKKMVTLDKETFNMLISNAYIGVQELIKRQRQKDKEHMEEYGEHDNTALSLMDIYNSELKKITEIYRQYR